MASALPATDIAQASTYLRGAVDATLRKRLLTGWLDKSGRINRNAQGKDWNWLIEAKEMSAQPYQAYQTLNFNNDNFNITAAVTPEWWVVDSGQDITERIMNSGTSTILDNYRRRLPKMGRAMSTFLAKALYADAATAAGANRPIGLGTFAKKHGSLATTNGDRIAPPVAGTTYATLDISLGAYGGTWSANSAVKMNAALATDWPDGQGDPTNAYDITSPRLYNENTNRWFDLTSAAANSNWRTNCIAMLSRANTDLRMNSLDSMMPNVHVSGSERYQNIKDKLRESYRDVMTHQASTDLGYHNVLSFEDAAIDLDHECPADRTYSVCAQSMELYFYGEATDEGKTAMQVSDDSQGIPGGIFTTFGPERPAGSLQNVWIMLAGGNTRYQPRWIVVHKDFTI